MINEVLNNYRIISLLGEGGMANVYFAQNQSLGKYFAIKLLKSEFVDNPNIRKRFIAEARILAQMSHPNIIEVIDLIDAGEIVAFVMEYIEGQNLELYLTKKGGLTDAEIDGFFNQMILAVLYVHKQGLIHRDIKPSNFMVTKNGQIILLDFGIAKNTNLGAIDYTKTALGEQMGTPLYMSPEQVKSSSEITQQTDYYSLGVVLWQLVKNKSPYDNSGFSLPEIQVAIIKEPLPLTHTIWDVLIQNATEKNPSKRKIIIPPKIYNKPDNKIDKGPNFIPKDKKQKIKEIFSYDLLIKSLVFIGLIFFLYLIITEFKSDPVDTTKDTDSDGFLDKDDNCVDAFSNTNFGCPEKPTVNEKDGDGDGYLLGRDEDDADPCKPDPTCALCDKGDDLTKKDTDKDGVKDSQDLCPLQFGLKETKGCQKIINVNLIRKKNQIFWNNEINEYAAEVKLVYYRKGDGKKMDEVEISVINRSTSYIENYKEGHYYGGQLIIQLNEPRAFKTFNTSLK